MLMDMNGLNTMDQDTGELLDQALNGHSIKDNLFGLFQQFLLIEIF